MADLVGKMLKFPKMPLAFIDTEPKFEGNSRNYPFCTLNDQKMPVQ